MNIVIDILLKTLGQVYGTFTHNWPFLLASVLVAVSLKLFMNAEKVSAFLIRYRKIGILGATAAAVGTPLCACGTTAVIIGMMASMMPWAPIVAFLVSSPLTSPQELVYSAGLFGWPFALAFFIASILLGLIGGILADILERAGWLENQARFAQKMPARSEAPAPNPSLPVLLQRAIQERTALASAQVCCAGEGQAALQLPTTLALQTSLVSSKQTSKSTFVAPASAPACGCSSQPAARPVEATPAACSTCSSESASEQAAQKPRVTAQMFLKETALTARNLLLMFFGFAFIGYLLNNMIPATWVSTLFGPGKVYSIPLAATLGLPLYINTEASLPLVRALIDGGMSQGAALAFLITGAGTSFGAIAGTVTIARWRVTALVIGTLWIGGMLTGFIYDLLLAAHLF